MKFFFTIIFTLHSVSLFSAGCESKFLSDSIITNYNKINYLYIIDVKFFHNYFHSKFIHEMHSLIKLYSSLSFNSESFERLSRLLTYRDVKINAKENPSNYRDFGEMLYSSRPLLFLQSCFPFHL